MKRSGWQGNLMSKNLLYALTLDGLLQSAVPLGSRVSLTYRLAAPVSKTTSGLASTHAVLLIRMVIAQVVW